MMITKITTSRFPATEGPTFVRFESLDTLFASGGSVTVVVATFFDAESSEVEVFPFGTSAGVNVASVVLGGSTPVIIFKVPTVNGPRLPSLTTFRDRKSVV